MNYCSQCGAHVTLRIPSGDNLPRYVCDSCGVIHYQNPKIVTGCIVEWKDKILLCRRAIEPRSGLWTLPAGFMENNETTVQAAARETYEEANARVDNLSLYVLYNLPHISQVYIMFRSQLMDGQASAGPESLEVEFFLEAQIPWEDIAFPVIRESLELYFQDREEGKFRLRTGDIIRMPDHSLQINRH